MPTISSSEESFLATLQHSLPSLLPEFLLRQRWFGGKARTIRSVEVSDIIPFQLATLRSYFILARVAYAAGPAEAYDIPLIHVPSESGGDSSWLRVRPHNRREEIALADAVTDQQFQTHLLDAIANGVSLTGMKGRIRTVSTGALPSLWQPSQGTLTPSVMNAEQSNSSVVYEKRLVLKIFRRVEEGLNPDLEIGAFLTEKSSFRNVPPLAGYLEYSDDAGPATSLGMLQGYIVNQGDAWQLTLQALTEYYAKVPQWGSPAESEVVHALLTVCRQAIPEEARQRIGSYLDAAVLLGRRTAELHLALASAQDDPNFAPQPFAQADQVALMNSGLQLLAANFDVLRRRIRDLPGRARLEADQVLLHEEDARRRFHSLDGLKTSAWVTRIHGDYHLGQVLSTGSDFVIVDFEGEPARPLEQRRKKRSPLQDVAGMLRSFHYAAYAPLLQQANAEKMSQERLQTLTLWAQYWQLWVSAAFLKTYLEVSKSAIFIPKDREELALLLNLYLLDKAVYELGYELNNRPAWVRIPLAGISQLL